ncbi:hypothetical protein AGABI1DRAFT_35200 [Agaricus bisporus var. burnettii JB137-S8]|uniref:Inositol-pentakisphosphate 2-kinase n=1 Tax=Agaricus bisporus var. burnettii (strain JB137-S8 / ATCC MYA-4627 / FGSC 10392) TaxID=597362 RepID=K5Y3Q6_AGABU|nr:uncharacterized protein AGABI1DRAFT_35200 [Agaricus bisporus var. burnettii JB137-S8]EKM82580.1 hypothetical protein AGABI1DRAFT_35200 [Agaricus bisporus var. burnettii JB137-S8]
MDKTRPTDWKYVSEGGATIVFSYVGPPNPAYDGTVLRLRKVTTDVEDVSAVSTTEDEPDDRIIEYQTRCMERLIPRHYLPRLESVALERRWLEQLATVHDAERPGRRIGKDHIDLTRHKGVLATDLVGGNWIAVEIKPKWAFLPSPTHLSQATKLIKTQTCRFCMHSHMRSSKDCKYANKYCPLDLFSGNPHRVQQAIDDLWDAWERSDGEVNNLKIFSRGKAVRPGQVRLFLLMRYYFITSISPDRIQEVFKKALCDTLLQSPILSIISRLQRMLDVLDIEGLSKLWREAQLESLSDEQIQVLPLGVSQSEPGMTDWVDFVTAFESVEMKELDHDQPRTSNLRYYILAYLLSATFKDCSIIARLGLLKPGNHSEIQEEPIRVIDLDPKSLNRLPRWEELDREIVMSYVPAERKMCVDENIVPSRVASGNGPES